ncbi:hypothetical protein P3342_004253 [Pyrenophora teres f. teres]|nr:hypothetical protein P3342_004253 [Pyrenophora teres f. teres]
MLLPTGCPDYLRLILTSRVYEVVTETPLTHATNLSSRFGCNVLLKREDLQPIFSCKLRGIYNKMAHIDLATAGAALSHAIPAVVVMPLDTPDVKIKNVSRFGCSVILHGTDFDAARQEAARLEKLHGLVSIPALDDPYVIAGQGTVGMEILRQTDLQNLTAIFCCVGLVAGIGVYIKRVAPHVKIIGVEHFNANAIVQSLKASKRVVLSEVGLFADSGSIKTADEETVRVCREVVDEIVQATTDEACAAIKDMFEDTRSIVEPAGALALAGLKKWVSRNPLPNLECSLVAITSGADMEFHHLRFVAERAAFYENEKLTEGPFRIIALKSPPIGKNTLQVSALTSVHPYTVDRIYSRAIAAGFEPNELPIKILPHHVQDAPKPSRPAKQADELVYAQIARKYSVEPTTLARRHKGVSTSRSREAQNRQALHPQQELELLRYIQRLTRQGLPPTRAMIRNFASQITQREVGIHWVDRFVQRHPDELISKWTTSIDNNRHKADSAKKYSLYFDLLREKIEQYHVEARYIYNMDEKGFMLSAVGRSKRIFSRTSFETGKRRSTIQDGSREWITLLACICADGSYLEPALIYKSASSLIQNTWLQALDHETHQVRITSSPSSWTNNDIGLAWLKQVFDRSIKAKARSSYRLLILDGHGSHLTIDFIEYCDQNKILLAIYPPHSTHTLQPLDVVLFKPLDCILKRGLSFHGEEPGPHLDEQERFLSSLLSSLAGLL